MAAHAARSSEQPLRAMCALRGWKITREYVDHGFSGAKESRPGLDKLMLDAQRGYRDIEAIACWKFDRFARSTKHLLRALETFQGLGIAFVSLTESVDTSTPYGKLVFTTRSAIGRAIRTAIGRAGPLSEPAGQASGSFSTDGP
jgi:DNA invertase Pin-like site-specific DNA recombinase